MALLYHPYHYFPYSKLYHTVPCGIATSRTIPYHLASQFHPYHLASFHSKCSLAHPDLKLGLGISRLEPVSTFFQCAQGLRISYFVLCTQGFRIARRPSTCSCNLHKLFYNSVGSVSKLVLVLSFSAHTFLALFKHAFCHPKTCLSFVSLRRTMVLYHFLICDSIS